MNYFKQASREKLRFLTSQGNLSVEQLWGLRLTPLATIIRGIKKQLKKENDDELSFLDGNATSTDKTMELRFNVAKEIYVEMKEEKDAVKTEAAKKEHNEKIMALISKKQEGELEGKSVEELTALLKA
jgi:hypothetical protein